MKYAEFSLGQVEAVFNKLGGDEGVRRFLAGDRKIEIVRHIINTKLPPYYDDEFFSVVEERASGDPATGLLEWDISKIELRYPQRQNGTQIFTTATELGDCRVLNATVRDYLLKHQSIIPDSWRGHILCFWGTIFEGSGGTRYLPTMRMDKGRWRNEFVDLQGNLSHKMVALIQNLSA